MPVVVPDQQRAHHHADDRRRQQRLQQRRSASRSLSISVSSAKPNSPPWPRPARRATPCACCRLPPRATSVTIDRLDHLQRDHQQQHQPPLAEQQLQIEQRADRDEEQAEQHVAERPDDGLELVAVLGFREQHAGEKPAQAPATDRPRASPTRRRASTSSVASVNSSVLRARPISWNSGRTSQRRNVSTSASAIAACRIGLDDFPGARVLAPLLASALSSASSGTNARSWNSRMPIAMRLCVRFSSACSPSWRITMAVEDIASAPPIMIGDQRRHVERPQHAWRTPPSSAPPAAAAD